MVVWGGVPVVGQLVVLLFTVKVATVDDVDVTTVDGDEMHGRAHFLASGVTCRLGLGARRCGSICRVGFSFVCSVHCLVSSMVHKCR